MCTAIVWNGLILKCWRSEYHTRAITFAMAFTFDTISAHWPFLSTLDSTFATSQTASLRPFSGKFGFQRGLSGRSVCSSVRPFMIMVALFAPGIGLHAVDAQAMERGKGSTSGEILHCGFRRQVMKS